MPQGLAGMHARVRQCVLNILTFYLIQEDSGGPLVLREKRNYFSLVGLVSLGYGYAQSNTPGVYARITSQLKWIKKQIEGSTCPRPKPFGRFCDENKVFSFLLSLS